MIIFLTSLFHEYKPLGLTGHAVRPVPRVLGGWSALISFRTYKCQTRCWHSSSVCTPRSFLGRRRLLD